MNQYPSPKSQPSSLFETIRALCSQIVIQGAPQEQQEAREIEAVLQGYWEWRTGMRAAASAAGKEVSK